METIIIVEAKEGSLTRTAEMGTERRFQRPRQATGD